MKRPAAVDTLFASRELPKSQKALGEIREYIRGLERTASTVMGQNASLLWRHIDALGDVLLICRSCKLGTEVCRTCEHNAVESKVGEA